MMQNPLTAEAAKALVKTLASNRLDYCNRLLVGITETNGLTSEMEPIEKAVTFLGISDYHRHFHFILV